MSEKNYFVTVSCEASADFEEKKSVFIGHAKPVKTAEEAMEFVKQKKKEYADATHNVFAYLLEDGRVAKYSDDGEPQGTAGMPTLRAIEQRDVADVCVATTRYFGGILLGAGGLTRAYSAAAHAALESAGVTEYTSFTEVAVDLTYADHQRLTQELPHFEARERSVDFTDRVMLTVGLPTPVVADFMTRVTDLTAGRAIAVRGEEYLDVK